MKFTKLSELKDALVEAHRSRDWELAAQLSQEKQRLKKKNRCEVCGCRVGWKATLCYTHYLANRYYRNQLA